MSRTAALVLAAGQARRMGDTKMLLPLRGVPLVSHVVETAVQAGLSPVLVVVGHDAAGVTSAVRLPATARFVHAREHAAGQSASLRAGLAALLTTRLAAAVVLLGDEPTATPAAVRAVRAAARRTDRPIVRARYADGPGHPVLLRREVWPRLLELTGDAGARTLIRAHPGLVLDARVAGLRPVDVDTPADYRRLMAQTPR